MTDAVRAAERAEPILLRYLGRVAEILDLLELRGEPSRVAGIAQAITEGVRRGFGNFDGLSAEFGEQPVDLGLPRPDLLADMMVLGHILLLGELKAHDIFVGRRRAVDGKA